MIFDKLRMGRVYAGPKKDNPAAAVYAGPDPSTYEVNCDEVYAGPEPEEDNDFDPCTEIVYAPPEFLQLKI